MTINKNQLVVMALALLLLTARLAQAEEDCVVWCPPLFGPGVGVTCQAAVSVTDTCLARCYYSNGWWLSWPDFAVLRQPAPGGGDQRPLVTDVEPYGYATRYGYRVHAWGPCPGNFFAEAWPIPPSIWEWCQGFARSEYGEGEVWCSQFDERPPLGQAAQGEHE